MTSGPALVGFILLGLGAAALIVAAIVWQVKAAAARRRALEAWAAGHGFTLTDRVPGLEQAFRGFTPFEIGSSRRCSWVLAGQHNGHPVRVFHYQYTTQNGKSSQTHHYNVAAVAMAVDGSDLTIQKEHLGHKLFDALGGEDIDFESDEFSRRFWVRCKDRRFAYDVLHPRMQEWLIEHGERHWQWRGGTLLVYAGGGMRVEAVESLLGAAFAFIGHLPRHRMPAEASV